MEAGLDPGPRTLEHRRLKVKNLYFCLDARVGVVGAGNGVCRGPGGDRSVNSQQNLK